MGMSASCHSPFGFLQCEVEEEVVVRVSSQAILPMVSTPTRRDKLEVMLYELFCLQDLKSDGFLEEGELIQLNEGIAVLHYGRDVDRSRVRKKYKDLFREKLHPAGEPVTYSIFRRYMREVLDTIDLDIAAQEMIMDQFIAEATSAREFLGADGSFIGSPCSEGADLVLEEAADSVEGLRAVVPPTLPRAARQLARSREEHSRL